MWYPCHGYSGWAASSIGLKLVLQQSVLSSQSISLTKATQCVVKRLTWDKQLIREIQIRRITLWNSVRALTRRWRQVLRGPLPPFDPPTSWVPLKSLNSSHLLHLLPPQLPPYPAIGCWVHTIQLCRLKRSNGSGCRRSALNLRPLPFTSWHQFPLQSFASYWVYWCFIKYSFKQLFLCGFLSMGHLL